MSADAPSGGPPPASTAAALHQLDHDLRNVLGVLGGALAALYRHLPPDDAGGGRAAKALAQFQAGLDRGQDVAVRLRALALAGDSASGDPPSCDHGSGAA